MAVQLFYFVGPGSHRDGKVYHQAFALNGVNYQVGKRKRERGLVKISTQGNPAGETLWRAPPVAV
jgi:hypothetical protein